MSRVKEHFINNIEYEEAMESYESIDDMSDDEPISMEITDKGEEIMKNEEIIRAFQQQFKEVSKCLDALNGALQAIGMEITVLKHDIKQLKEKK